MTDELVRTGAASVVQLSCATETELDDQIKYVVERIGALSEHKTYIETFKKPQWDAEVGVEYWAGIVLHDFFLNRWEPIWDLDPAKNKVVIDVG